MASFAEVLFFAGVDLATDIVVYRITLSFVTVISIIFGVIRQWEIFQNTIVPKRWRSRLVFAAALVTILAGYGAFILYPPALFVLLQLATLAQLIAAADQFLVIRDNRSLALVIGYVIALSLSFGGACLPAWCYRSLQPSSLQGRPDCYNIACTNERHFDLRHTR